MRSIAVPTTLAVLALAGCSSDTQGPRFGAGDVVYLQAGAGSGAQRIVALDAATGKTVRELPAGQPTADWSRVYTATPASGGATRVAVADTTTGRVLRSTRIDGVYVLPAGGALSADGGTLAVAGPSDGRRSRFALVSSTLRAGARAFTLPGSFAFDAISPDGKVLFLIEHPDLTDPAHYSVRAYDVAKERLRAGVIVDKREADEPMEGLPTARVASPDGGHVYTLYRRAGKGPFIHDLDVSYGVARCIDLPRQAPSADATARRWGLAISRDGRRLYAANGALGTAIEFNLEYGSVTGTARFGAAPQRGAGGPSSYEAGGQGSVALAPDDRSLYVAGDSGVVALSTMQLAPRHRLLRGVPVGSLALSSDGRRLYAAGPGNGAVVALDTATGRVGARIAAAGGTSTLLRVARAQPQA